MKKFEYFRYRVRRSDGLEYGTTCFKVFRAGGWFGWRRCYIIIRLFGYGINLYFNF